MIQYTPIPAIRMIPSAENALYTRYRTGLVPTVQEAIPSPCENASATDDI